MRQMVGLIQRQGIFYFRRTIPEPLRKNIPALLQSAGPDIFRSDGGVSLRGRSAGREFWVSLGTRDEHEAREAARLLDQEADNLFRLAQRRLTLAAHPAQTEIDEPTVQRLVSTFRHRKLRDDEKLRRGPNPLSQQEFEALGAKIIAREAELRSANARGDCSATQLDLDGMMTVLDAGLKLEIGSNADQRVYRAFVEAELDLLAIIKERQCGETRPTPADPQQIEASESHRPAGERRSSNSTGSSVTLDQILAGWSADHKPKEKTVYTFTSKLRSWEKFLTSRGVTIHTAILSDTSDWKLELLKNKSAKSAANDLSAAKAIHSWAFANGKINANPFAGLKQPRGTTKGKKSKIRSYTEAEAVRVLTLARAFKGFRRWVPWIACFTGARLSEVCQLEKSDIDLVDGIYFFRMQTEEDRDEVRFEAMRESNSTSSLKTENSKRIIPMHSRLIEEGFLDFVKACTSKDLFADATPDRFKNRGGNATKIVGRWVRTKVGITDIRISPNHSFRHRFETICMNCNVDPEMRDSMIGHRRGTMSEVYGEGFWVSTLKIEIEKVYTPKGLV